MEKEEEEEEEGQAITTATTRWWQCALRSYRTTPPTAAICNPPITVKIALTVFSEKAAEPSTASSSEDIFSAVAVTRGRHAALSVTALQDLQGHMNFTKLNPP